jgi:hypothetical protein
LISSLFHQGEVSPLKGSTHPWVKLSSLWIEEGGFYLQGEETWISGGPSPLSSLLHAPPSQQQCGACLPKSVEQRTGQKPDSRCVN